MQPLWAAAAATSAALNAFEVSTSGIVMNTDEVSAANKMLMQVANATLGAVRNNGPSGDPSDLTALVTPQKFVKAIRAAARERESKRGDASGFGVRRH